MRAIKKSESLKQQVYNILKEDILNRHFVEEEVLNERKISEELNVSRTPVREALKALEAEGMVQYVPYKGVVIKKMGEKDLKNIFQIRTALEILTIDLAMPNLSKKFILELERCHKQQEALMSVDINKHKERFIDSDIEFHGILIKMADNELLNTMILDVRDKIRRFGMNAIFCGEFRYSETLKEHLAILNAVRLNDTELAKEKMRYHLQKTYESAYSYITTR